MKSKDRLLITLFLLSLFLLFNNQIKSQKIKLLREEITNVSSLNGMLKEKNEQLIKENKQLKIDKEIIISENEEIVDKLKSLANDTVNVFSNFKCNDKKSYLYVYKIIILNNIDPPETIYDYTTDEEFTLLCQVVQAESGICDFDGKVNVASTIINRYFSETFPNGWKDLLFQKDNGIYQYTTIQNKSYLKQTNISEDTKYAIEYAFLFGSEVQDSTYFHSGNSNWHENNLEFVYQDKWHKFYKEKGE